MAIHRETTYHSIPKVDEWDCAERGDCPAHGPFPSRWRLHSAAVVRTDDAAFVEWERYTAPYTIEVCKVRVPAPEQQAPRPPGQEDA